MAVRTAAGLPTWTISAISEAGRHLRTRTVGRVAFLAFLALLLGYGVLLACYTLANLDVVNLHRDSFIDDTFYYLETAKNLAAGKFSTFDGGITRTNGYHPVWLLLVTPFYWVFDAESALFAVMALQIMLIAAGVCLVAVAVRLALQPWIVLFAALPALYCEPSMLLGLEAAAGLFFLGATFVCLVLFVHDARRWRWALAGVVFLLPWVRLEYAGISLLVATAVCFLPASPRAGPLLVGGSAQEQRWRSAVRLRIDGVPLLAAVAGILAYFLYNGVVFGGIVPVSGATKLAWSQRWFEEGIGRTADWLALLERFVSAASTELLAAAELAVYALLAATLGRLCGWRNEYRLALAVFCFVLSLCAHTLALQAQLLVFYHPDIKLVGWYFVPGHLATALMVPVRCYAAILLLRFALRRRPAVAGAGVVAVCAVGAYAAFDRYDWTEPFRSVNERRDSTDVAQAWGLASYFGGHVIGSMLAEDAVVGSWDSGTIGYVSDLPVVNLDGLANSYGYLRIDIDAWDLWLRRGGVPGFGVTDFVNVVRDTNKASGFEYVGWRMTLAEENFRVKMWPNGDRSRRSKSWRDIVLPSRNMDGSPNGYAELRLGRLVQVFLPDCDPEQVPEMLTFSWAQGAEQRSRTRLWPHPFRTELGYCTALFMLPSGAEKAKTIAIEATSINAFLAGATPVAQGAYNVYVVERTLVLVKDRCTAGTTATRYLHVYPTRRRDLPLSRQRFGFDNRDVRLALGSRTTGERCVVVSKLPAYEIDWLATGELGDGGRHTWHARVDIGAAVTLEELLSRARMLVRTDYDIYLNRERNLLLYLRGPCSPDEPPSVMFLHLYPERTADLPAYRQQYGFDNHDFDLPTGIRTDDGRCWAARSLPDYEIHRLNTGQIVDGERVWEVDVDLAERQ